MLLSLAMTSAGPAAASPVGRVMGGDDVAVAAAVTTSTVPATNVRGASPRPGTSVPPSVVAPAAAVLVGDQSSPVDDADFMQVVASPRYEEDGIVFATGDSGCCNSQSVAVWRSADRGATWARLPSLGFRGTGILLPPSYPDDPTIFATGGPSLLASFDGGESFVPVAPAGGEAAISPDFTNDRTIILGSSPGWRYTHGDVPRLEPLVIGLPLMPVPLVPAFSPNYARDRTVYFGAVVPSLQGALQPAVVRCVEWRCQPPVLLPVVGGTPQIAFSPRAEDAGLVYVSTGGRAFRSVDGGRTFQPLDVGVFAWNQVISVDRDGRLVVAVSGDDGGGWAGGITSSGDGGTSWHQQVAVSRDQPVFLSILPLGDGRIIAAPIGASGGGLACSTDGGTSWTKRCPAGR